MDWNKRSVRGLLLVVCGGIAFYYALQHLPLLFAGDWLMHILTPFLLGGAIAFVLNVPMRAIERNLMPGARRARALRRPLALLLTLVCVVGVLILAAFVIGPNVGDAVLSVARHIPAAADRVQEKLEELAVYLPQLEKMLEEIDVDWNAISRKVLELARNWGSGILSSGSGIIGGIIGGVSTFVIGLIFSFYILLQKEKLTRQGKQVLYALLREKHADRVLDILTLASRTFSNFLSGQCLEAVILGSMFAVTLGLFRMPYALLIGVLIALTALVPIVGAFIGCAVGALLIAIIDPWKAVGFIVIFLVLQQLEGNLIYPHVVGSSVGLPSIWVLAAVTLGGKLMGVAGILLFIPLCSVLYALFRGFIKHRLVVRGVAPEKWGGKAPVPPESSGKGETEK